MAYEVVDYDYYADGEHWDRVSLVKAIDAENHDNQVHGVVLFQLLNDRTIQVEAFPGKPPPRSTGSPKRR